MIKKALKKLVTRLGGSPHRLLKKRSGQPTAGLAITVGDLDAAVAESLAEAFADVEPVEVICGDLTKVECDAIVSPANSFGDMGGGIDKAIDDAFEGALQPAVQASIRELYLGELPVGTAIIVPTDRAPFPFVVVAPTMRIPGSVSGTVNAYLAMRAVLANVIRFNESQPAPTRSVAVPGLGTGIGGLDSGDAARQMRVAYDNVILQHWKRVLHPAQAPFASR